MVWLVTLVVGYGAVLCLEQGTVYGILKLRTKDMKSVSMEHSFGSAVTAIAEDPLVTGNIIIATKDRIVTVNAETLENPDLITSGPQSFLPNRDRPTAKLGHIKSILTLWKSSILVVDRLLHCVHIISRKSNETLPLVGRCGSGGNKIGSFGEAMFQNPEDLLLDNLKGYLTDSSNQVVKLLDFKTSTVSELVYDLPYGSDFIDKIDNHLYVTSQVGLFYVNLKDSDRTVTKLEFQMRLEHGKLEEVDLRSLNGLCRLGDSPMLLTSTRTQLLLLDLQILTAEIICANEGPVCRIHQPGIIRKTELGLFVVEDMFQGHLHRLPYSEESKSWWGTSQDAGGWRSHCDRDGGDSSYCSEYPDDAAPHSAEESLYSAKPMENLSSPRMLVGCFILGLASGAAGGVAIVSSILFIIYRYTRRISGSDKLWLRGAVATDIIQGGASPTSTKSVTATREIEAVPTNSAADTPNPQYPNPTMGIRSLRSNSKADTTAPRSLKPLGVPRHYSTTRSGVQACSNCGKACKTKAGLNSHVRSCIATC